MREQTKALPRRRANPEYQRYFTGHGLDIGSGPDPLHHSKFDFGGMISALPWDKEQGDAQTLPGVDDESFDFIFASHILEHLTDPWDAIKNWIRATKRGGYLVITVPDWEMYERKQWPSRFSAEHKWSFTTDRTYRDTGGNTIYLPDILKWASKLVLYPAMLERLQVIREGFIQEMPVHVDQTMGEAECAIEFVLRRVR